MLIYPRIDPVLVKVGPLSVHWYAVMYLLGFAIGYTLFHKRAKETGAQLGGTLPGDLLVYVIFGVLLGGRIGYALFYKPIDYLTHPANLFHVWEGGMAFHGALIGVLVAGTIFCRKHKVDFYLLADTIVPLVPIGLALGRLGNFINGELYGRYATVPWAMIFPQDPLGLPRHPSQLYELGLEGICLGLLLWSVRFVPMPRGSLFWIFISGYGTCRLIAECFREPDAQLMFLFPGVTTGMLVSLPMVVLGLFFLVRGWRKQTDAARVSAAA